MIILIPWMLDPTEYLVEHRQTAKDLGKHAIATALDVAQHLSTDEASVVVTAKRDTVPMPAQRALGQSHVRLIHLDTPVGPETLPFVPLGTQHSLQALSPQPPVIILNFRAPLVTAPDLVGAYAQSLATQEPLLISATAPRDHPCQGKILYDFMGPLLPMAEGTDLHIVREGDQIITLDQSSPQDAVLIIMGKGGKRVLEPQTDAQGNTFFLLPKGLDLPENPCWALARPTTAPGPGRFLFAYAPDNAPWQRDTSSGQMRTLSGASIAGRQEFPAVLEADDSFCIVKTLSNDFYSTQNLQHQTWPLPQERSLCINNALAALCWNHTLSTENLPST